MKKLTKIKFDGSLKISFEKCLFTEIRKVNTWYTGKHLSVPALIILGGVDVMGFLQILKLTFAANAFNRVLVTIALIVAFEIAPLYIGYALCLKSYKLGGKIHTWVLLFSSSACILGIVAHTAFRIMTMNFAYSEKSGDPVPEIALPMTVMMCALPIITSLINLTIGCLTFDPLLFELLKISKKLQKLKLRQGQIVAHLDEFSNDTQLMDDVMKNEEKSFDSVQRDIYALRSKLMSYATIKISAVTNSK